jgi:hypothetical protein
MEVERMGRIPPRPGVAGPPSPIERVLANENGLGAEVLFAVDRVYRAVARGDEQATRTALKSMVLAWCIVAEVV